MMLMASPMLRLHSLGQDDQYEVQHYFCGHATPLALVSHDAYGVMNGTIAFLRLR